MTDKNAPPGTTKVEGAKTDKKDPKAEKDPNAPKTPRSKPVPYGFLPGAKISLTEDAAKKGYKGKRLEYFERLKAANGKTVEDFAGACPKDDPPRGWLRFFVQDGACTLSGGKKAEPKPKAEKKEDKKAA